MFTLLVILAIFLQVAIALGVFYRRQGGHVNFVFMLLSLSLAGWALTDYIAISIPQNQATIYAIRSVLSLVVIENTLFYLFAQTFPDIKLSQIRYLKPIIVYSTFVLFLTQSPFLFTSVAIKNGTANPNAGPVILFFIFHAFITIIPGLRYLYLKFKNSIGQKRRQLFYILFASTILWLIVPVTNFAITLSAKTTIFVKLSPFYTLLFGAFIAYAIVAHKLFDIRAAVARSVAYILIVGSMTLTYGIVLFGIVDELFKGSNNEFLRQSLSVILLVPFAMSFQTIRNFFDRLSSKMFYRDDYDFQEVINEVSKIVVGDIELHKILINTRFVLTDALKCSFVEFVIYKNDRPYFEAHMDRLLNEELVALGSKIENQRGELVIVDEMKPQSTLQPLFRGADVSLSLRLKTHKHVVGYILFGPKKSGDIYNAQDEKLLLITANQLAVAVQNALRFDEIQNFNLTLQSNVDVATKRLRLANLKLKSLDETKDDFISMASHQLRTPLTSVKGYLSMILEGDTGKINKTQRNMISQAYISSQRMVYLISDMLNVSRINTGKFAIINSPVNLAILVEEELNQIKETAAVHSLTLTYNKPKDFPTLMIDETKMRQVIMNFADNAIYYTPTGGNITIELNNNPHTVDFKVVDDGIGVPINERHHIFTKFYRAHNARKARPDGTGLGLYMARKVIVAQGGATIFESQEGKGSTFGFILDKSKLKDVEVQSESKVVAS